MTNTVDRLGRTIGYEEKQGATVRFSRSSIVYADGGRSMNVDTETQVEAGVSRTINNDYDAAGNLASSDVNGTGGALSTYTYQWWDHAVRKTETVNPDASSTNGVTTFSFDGHGRVAEASVDEGALDRVVTYTTAASGQVMTRVDGGDESGEGGLSQYYYYFEGERVASLGRLDQPEASLAAQIAGRGSTPSSTAFRADFDQNWQPLNASAPAGAPTFHTVAEGDTLASIAAGLWGDASVWYLIAQANGLQALGPDDALSAGTTLLIPNTVTNLHNTSETFNVYDPLQALGDVRPDNIAPPMARDGGGCGMIGKILVVAVAAAVAYFAAPLAPAISSALGGGVLGGFVGGAAVGGIASVASQGFGVATGIQDSFSWKGVGIAAISGGIAGGFENVVGANGLFGAGAGRLNDVARGVITNAATQGLAVATGLQDKFSWAGVAAAGAVSGAMAVSGRALGAPHGPIEAIGGQLLTGMAGAIAGAATRSALTGSNFGDNVIASIPDVIGATIGNAFAGAASAAGPRPMVGDFDPDPRTQLAMAGDMLSDIHDFGARAMLEAYEATQDGPTIIVTGSTLFERITQFAGEAAQQTVTAMMERQLGLTFSSDAGRTGSAGAGQQFAFRQRTGAAGGQLTGVSRGFGLTDVLAVPMAAIRGQIRGRLDTVTGLWNDASGAVRGAHNILRDSSLEGQANAFAESQGRRVDPNAPNANRNTQRVTAVINGVGSAAGDAWSYAGDVLSGERNPLLDGGGLIVDWMNGQTAQLITAFRQDGVAGMVEEMSYDRTRITDEAALAVLPIGGAARWTVRGAGAADSLLLDASRSVDALPVGAAARGPTGQFYSVAFEMELSPASYPGPSRAQHFQEANASLLRTMEADVDFAKMMGDLRVDLQRTTTGLAPRTSPGGWTWHHALEPGVMQLVPRLQHAQGSIFQGALHPDGRGGYFIWGGE